MALEDLMARCLTTFESWFYYIANFIKGPGEFLPDDIVSVFIKDRKQFDKKTGKLVAGAFAPKPYKGRLETSIFRVNGLSNNQIWDLGHRWTVINPWPRKSGCSHIRGRGEISVQKIRQTESLYASVDPSPHPRHGNILGWPEGEAQRCMKALELVAQAELIMKSK